VIGVDWIAEIVELSREAGDRVSWQPPVTPIECADLEASLGIVLPDEYKAVLQRVGNGCSGILEVFALGRVGGNEDTDLADYLGETDLVHPFKHETGSYWISGPEEDDDVNDDFGGVHGALPVADNQAGGQLLLVITGRKDLLHAWRTQRVASFSPP
jgi:hypothetical protein